jgi:predicted DCC family thiol-disulfide oxidoreductase YuxK
MDFREEDKTNHPLLFYDGDCAFCSHAVAWVCKRDKKDLFRFSPIGGRTWERLKNQYPSKAWGVDSVIVFTPDNQILIQEEAVLYLTKSLNHWYWNILKFIPRPLLNWGYNLVARYRKKLHLKACPLLPAGKVLP